METASQGEDGLEEDGPEIEPDGRRRRSQRSRERILDAVAKALEQPDLELTAEQITAGAGVSMSTLFRHFGDMQGLAEAMRARVMARALPIMRRGPFEGDRHARVADLVDRRTAVFEEIAPLFRVTLRRPDSPTRRIEEQRNLDEAMNRQLRAALAEEFAADATREPALRALLSFGSWDHLRLAQGREPENVRRILEDAVHRLLA